ncbi:MAG: FAD-dependent oxidoreductase [Myxococcales bacterium]|nr:FAD-dependent oxidoreductase [Myxococcales bacterium]
MSRQIQEERSETAFADFKPPLTRDQAVVEANRCLYCTDAPCVKACPTHIEIPQFIRKIATGNVKGSARTIFESNIFGMSCARVCPVEVLCVGDCVYNEMGVPPIQIGKLQRYATDMAFAEKWEFFQAGPDTGKKVALIGGGPASLACAHELRRAGHATTIFEKRASLGGLNTTGVAPYKMRADKSVEEVEWILGIGGIEVKTGVEVGKDISFADLEKQYDAVFFGAGLGPDSRMSVPGEDLPGVVGAVDWIEKMKLGKVPMTGVKRVVVVGGGNTAIDAVREAIGLVPAESEVVMVYRGQEDRMSGYAHEWKAAKVEGARALWQAIPVAFEGSGKVERVRCQRLDANKKPIAGFELTIDADLVLVAIGQSKLGAMLASLGGIQIESGKVVTDDRGGTGRKGWFAGGDARNGGKEVVNAAAEGKAAALAIHDFLSGGSRG